MHSRGIDHDIGLQRGQARLYRFHADDFDLGMGKPTNLVIMLGKRLHDGSSHLSVCSHNHNPHATSKVRGSEPSCLVSPAVARQTYCQDSQDSDPDLYDVPRWHGIRM